MPSEQSYQNTFTSGDPEYLLQLALSSALGEPLQTLMDKDASSWAESAQPETTVTAQNETMEATVEATGTKRMPNSPDAEDTTKSKTRRRKGDPEPDYSSMTREVLKTNQRTGQACDRCKVRPNWPMCNITIFTLTTLQTGVQFTMLTLYPKPSYGSCVAIPLLTAASHAWLQNSRAEPLTVLLERPLGGAKPAPSRPRTNSLRRGCRLWKTMSSSSKQKTSN